jgi:hypothetical protein
MNIIFISKFDADIEKRNLHETWERCFFRNDVLCGVEKIESITSDTDNLVLENGDVVLNVPRVKYEVIQEKKSRRVDF